MIRRTLLVTAMFPPAVGGAERYLETVARDLEPGQITVVAPPHPQSEKFDENFPARIIRRNVHAGWLRPSWVNHIGWLIRLVRREKITRVVFGHYAGFVGVGPFLLALTGIPYVVSVFGLDFVAYRKTAIRRWLLRWTLRHAEWVTTISSYTRQLLVEFGVPDGKIVLAPPSVQPRFLPDHSAIHRFRSDSRISAEAPMMVTVGRLVRRKGHSRVLKALPAVLAKHPDLVYVVIGDGPHRPALEQLAQSLGISRAVRFLGRAADATVSSALAAATLFIMTPFAARDDVEGFGIAYTEAMSAGLPVVATISGGVRDIIRNEHTGLGLSESAEPTEIADAILRLLGNTELRTKLGQDGKKFVNEHFTPERQLDPFRAILAGQQALTDPPAVSIVIPTYNAAGTISKTIYSLQSQSFNNIEIIVVDDGSTDETLAVARRHSEVTVLQQPHAGAPAARNRGRDVARGTFILFCDADVTLHPRMLERMVTALILKPDAAYAYSNFRFGWRTFDLFDFDAVRLRQSNYISMMSLIRRDRCPRFDESLTRLQDWDLWLTMLEQGHRGTWVPGRLFSAAIGRGGISRRIQAPPVDAVDRIRKKHQLKNPGLSG